MNTKYLLIFVLVVVSLVSGCARVDNTTFRWAIPEEPATLDSRQSQGTAESYVLYQLFEGLTTENAKGDVVPGVASSWEIDDNGSHYVFHLRDSKWSNGDPVTAYDFEYTWLKTLSPEFGSHSAEMLYFIKNAEAYNSGKVNADLVGIKAIDAHTLDVRLQAPAPFFLNLVGYNTKYLPVNKKVAEANPHWMERPESLVSNGAFVLQSWDHGSKMLFSANDNYWNKSAVKLKAVSCVFVDNAQTDLSMFESGQLDMSEAGFPATSSDKLIQENKLKFYPSLALTYIGVNSKTKPFDDARVRKALALAIDRNALVSANKNSGRKPAYGLVPYGIIDSATGKDFRVEGGALFDENVSLAKRLLSEAGFPDGNGFPASAILYSTDSASKQTCEIIQDMWKRNLGIAVTLTNCEWKVYLQQMQSGNFSITRGGWSGDYIDPLTFLNLFVSTDGNNRVRYNNARYDKLVRVALATGDQSIRMRDLHAAEKVIMDDMGVIPIYFSSTSALVASNVSGVIRDATGSVLLREAQKN